MSKECAVLDCKATASYLAVDMLLATCDGPDSKQNLMICEEHAGLLEEMGNTAVKDGIIVIREES